MLVGFFIESCGVIQKKVASRVGPVLLGFILFVVVGSGNVDVRYVLFPGQTLTLLVPAALLQIVQTATAAPKPPV